MAGPSAGGGSRALTAFPDWCDAEWPGLMVYVCEQYVASPIWCTVFVADGIALWIIVCILRRQREQDGEMLERKLARPRAARVRGAWRTLGALVRLSTMGAAARRVETPWNGAWERVTKARAERKEYLKRRDFEIGGVMTRAFGPVIVLALWLLIGFEVHAFYTVALPWFQLGERWRLPVGAVAGVFPVRIFLDYARTTFTDPGRPDSGASGASAGGDVELGTPGQKTCRQCQRPKPPRTHHCKVCRRCVLKMDHHCPFVANCIGLHNYRYFCCLLLELAAGCFVLAASLAPQFLAVTRRRVEGMTIPHQLHIVAAEVVAAIVVMIMGPFFWFHIQLVVMNQTTLEFMARRAMLSQGKSTRDVVSYNRGLMENFSEVCGVPPWWCRRPLEETLRRLILFSLQPKAKRSA